MATCTTNHKNVSTMTRDTNDNVVLSTCHKQHWTAVSKRLTEKNIACPEFIKFDWNNGSMMRSLENAGKCILYLSDLIYCERK